MAKNRHGAMSLLGLLGFLVFAALVGGVSGCDSEPKTDAKTEAAMRDNFKGAPDPSKLPPEKRAQIEAIMKANGAGPSRSAGGATPPKP